MPICVSCTFYYYPLDACLFLRRDRKGVNSDGRSGKDLGGIGGWEVIISTLYTKRNYLVLETEYSFAF